MKPSQRLTAISLWSIFFACLLCTGLWSTAAVNYEKAESVMLANYGDTGVKALQAWEQLLDENQQTLLSQTANQAAIEKIPLNEVQIEEAQIQQVNDFFNQRIRFEDDIRHWKKNDYWATPMETLGSGAGDCEDYTIAKYISLLQLGIPIERLRLIYVKAQIGGPSSRVFQAHMVLGYYSHPNAVPLILDSLIAGIEPADKRNDLHPIFSFNSEGLWVGNQAQPQIDPTARLSRWRDVLTRMKQEGF